MSKHLKGLTLTDNQTKELKNTTDVYVSLLLMTMLLALLSSIMGIAEFVWGNKLTLFLFLSCFVLMTFTVFFTTLVAIVRIKTIRRIKEEHANDK